MSKMGKAKVQQAWIEENEQAQIVRGLRIKGGVEEGRKSGDVEGREDSSALNHIVSRK